MLSINGAYGWLAYPIIGLLVLGRGLGFRDEPFLLRWGLFFPLLVILILDVIGLRNVLGAVIAATCAFVALALQVSHFLWRQEPPERRWSRKKGTPPEP